ncbi:calcium homeostasis modulator protein 6 [Diceros bicornis minor]|uniref:calcium homeostasis modulator protein 6 n=1 Tax=Diceros bicornis minor TaxID=77932 RepID=UPI0026EA08AB|nr:calcium homeostasis modulator protein 6 [Diceros bicornis minor]
MASWGRTVEKLWTVLALHLKHHSKMGCCLVTLLTAGGERILFTVAFQCPCSASWNLPYSLVFLLVPALALFLLGCVLSAPSLRLLMGCRVCKGCCACKGCCTWCELCCQVSGSALLASLTWVAVALLGGAVYECGASGSTEVARRLCAGRDSSCAARLPLVPCQQAGEPDVQDLLRELRAQSQVCGWSLIIVVIIFVLIMTCISECRAAGKFPQLKFWKIYSEQEKQILKTQVTEHATELAEENVKCFFEHSHPEECNIPSVEDWQQISLPYTFNPKNKYYSPLHKYVNTREKEQNISSSKGGEEVCFLGRVDSPDKENTV